MQCATVWVHETRGCVTVACICPQWNSRFGNAKMVTVLFEDTVLAGSCKYRRSATRAAGSMLSGAVNNSGIHPQTIKPLA